MAINMRLKTDFNTLIRNGKRNTNLTEPEIAVKLGVSRSLVGQWMNGYQLPKEKYLKNIAAILELDYEKLESAYSSSYEIRKQLKTRERSPGQYDPKEPHEKLIEGYPGLIGEKYLQADDKKKEEIRKGLESLLRI